MNARRSGNVRSATRGFSRTCRRWARASVATGRYPHQTGYWENAIPYDGQVPSWMHRLRNAGHKVTAVGKLHFRSTDDDNGFTEEIIPMHIVDGVGQLVGLLRGTGLIDRRDSWIGGGATEECDGDPLPVLGLPASGSPPAVLALKWSRAGSSTSSTSPLAASSATAISPA